MLSRLGKFASQKQLKTGDIKKQFVRIEKDLSRLKTTQQHMEFMIPPISFYVD